MRVALFTGAGASRAIGYPLTAEFLPRIRDELKKRQLFAETNGKRQDQADRKELRDLLCGLLRGFERASKKNLPLITDVFSMVEYAIAAGESLPIGGDQELRRFRELLKQAIADILVGDYLTLWDATRKRKTREERTLDRLITWIERQGSSLGIVTTNYDIGLENALYPDVSTNKLARYVDLGFGWRGVKSGSIHLEAVSKPDLLQYYLAFT